MSNVISTSGDSRLKSSSWFGALPVLARRHFSPFKMYVRRDLNLVVVLNPKVGSTTFRKVLVSGLQQIGEKPLLGPHWPVRLERRYETPAPQDLFHVLMHPGRYQFHCFVRNPYARIVSAWMNKLADPHARGSYPRTTSGLVPVIRRFAARRGLPGSEPESLSPFRTFVAYVESQPEGRRDHHWDTQRSVLFTDLLPYDRVHILESGFTAGMIEILTRIGLSPDWIVQQLERPRNVSSKPAQPLYDAELADQVYRIYAGDFAEFGYDRDSWRGL
jgi:hypothetical protein